jgi:hypothetical protein
MGPSWPSPWVDIIPIAANAPPRLLPNRLLVLVLYLPPFLRHFWARRSPPRLHASISIPIQLRKVWVPSNDTQFFDFSFFSITRQVNPHLCQLLDGSKIEVCFSFVILIFNSSRFYLFLRDILVSINALWLDSFWMISFNQIIFNITIFPAHWLFREANGSEPKGEECRSGPTE